MQHQALGRFVFLKRHQLEKKSTFAVDQSSDELTYFEVQSVGADVLICKPGDMVTLRAGNYEPLPLLGSEEQLYMASDDDVAGSILNV